MSRLTGWPRAHALPDDVTEVELVAELDRIALLPPGEMTVGASLSAIAYRNALHLIRIARRRDLPVGPSASEETAPAQPEDDDSTTSPDAVPASDGNPTTGVCV